MVAAAAEPAFADSPLRCTAWMTDRCHPPLIAQTFGITAATTVEVPVEVLMLDDAAVFQRSIGGGEVEGPVVDAEE